MKIYPENTTQLNLTISALRAENNSLKSQMQADVAMLKTQFESDAAALKEQLDKALAQITWFKEQVKLIRHTQFGKHSEKTVTQLTLFDEHESDEVEEAVEPLSATREQVTYSRALRTKTVGRKIDTSKLPREKILHDLPESEKTCCCGHLLVKIGEDTSETLEIIPAILKVIEHTTPKYTCRACETIKAAKKPEAPLPKSMAGSTLITDVIIKKYDHHLPLYRQSKIFAQSGIDIPDNTMGNWVMGAADVLAPLGVAFWNEIIASNYMQLDETTVKILMPDKKGYMWVYQSLDPTNKFIIYEFNLTREAAVPENRMKKFKGLLQTDGYSGYKKLGTQNGITHLGCWDHARRKFVDVMKINGNNKACFAYECLMLINQLYDIEREIKESSNDARYQARQEKSKPILDVLFEKVKSIKALPKSTLGTAITYLKNNEIYLRRYIDNGQAQISNILTENKIRPFALGRKNWLFVGNEESANKSALLYSLIESCKINNINVRNYLTYVLNNVHAMRRGEIDPKSLLPQFINSEILA